MTTMILGHTSATSVRSASLWGITAEGDNGDWKSKNLYLIYSWCITVCYDVYCVQLHTN